MRHEGPRCSSLSESMFRFIGRSCVASAFTMLGVLPERAELLTRCLFETECPFQLQVFPCQRRAASCITMFLPRSGFLITL